MKKYSIRFISSLLSVLLVIMSLPVTAFAADFSGDTSPPTISQEEANHDIVEIVDMRTATDKYFRLDDGSYYVAHYNSDVHYLDDNGVWQDIDNSLAVNGSEITTSDAKIKLAKKTTGNSEIFTIHDGNRKLSLALNGANKKVEGIISNNETEFDDDATQLQKMTTLDKISASVRYNDILENVDLEYVIKGANIKENIIVKAKASNYSYSFTLSLNNLVASLNEKNEIVISDSSTSEIIYLIPAPIMWDANDVYSDDIAVSLTDNNNGKYTLTITPDQNWMDDVNRVYPITIDPPIYTSSSSSVLDLDFQTNSTTSTATSNSLWVNSVWRAYWKLTTLPSIPASAYITNAEFSLKCFTNTDMSGYVAVYDVLTNWDSTLTYDKTVAATSPQGKPAEHFSDFQNIYYETEYVWGNISERITWNVTPIVKKWYAGENYGLMLAPATDTVFNGTAKFYSNDHTVQAERPQLCIEYRDMKGVEDYWTFSSQSAGFAGTGSVNNATGNLVFSIPTLTTTDALMPITPAMVYNSALAAKDYSYSNAQTSNVSAYAPKGFKLNLNETLIKKSYTNASGSPAYYFIWADADGTEHYFMPTDTDNTYADEDGMLLTLFESTTCTITDSNENVRTFTSRSYPSGTSSGWYLSSIADKNGNKVTFTVDSSYRPITISLVPKNRTAIEQMKIAYNSDGDPYVVWNPNSGEGVVFRMSASATTTATVTSGGNYLRQTVRAHGGTTEAQWLAFYNTNSNASTSTITVDAVAQYTYNSSGLLLTATNNLSQYKISYGYDSAKRVTSVADRASTKTIDFNINSADAFYNKLTYDYVTDGSYESAWVSQVVSEIRKGSGTSLLSTTTWNYTYDENGNITQITNSSGVIQNKYYYDDLGQLTREDNRAKGYSYVYAYDNAGNITSKKTYAFTTGTLGTVQSTINYTYGDSSWKDLLTKYGSTSITYDTIGNPTAIGEQRLTWEGRQLTSWSDGEYITIDYGYNADGIRTFKEVYDADTGETTRHEYILSGSQIIKETVFVDGVESYTLVYLYDEAGAPLGYRYRTPSYASGVFDGYFFEKNLQGDIVAVYNQSGTKLISYTYDAWGSTTTAYLNGGGSTAARLNPFRYRGYYFDSETGFYYLQSRYYNPTWGRFINADESSYLGVGNAILSYNLFAYCANNPIMYVDPTGTFSWGKLAAIAAVTAVIAVSVVATVATFGAASVAGTIAITSAITIAAKATEVAVLQEKKSTQDGDSTVEVIDMVNTVFDYGGDIIGLTPVTKAAGFGSGFYSQFAPFQDSLELMKLDGSLRGLPSSAAGEFVNRFKNAKEFLSMPTSKSSYIISYGFAAIAVGNTIYSCFTSDPVARAESLGYALK